MPLCRETVLLLILLLNAAADAQNKVPYGTWFGHTLGRRADSIIVGRFARSTVLPHQGRLVRVSVSSVLKGDESEVVLIHGDDERLIAHPQLSKIYFLRRTPRGTMRRLVDVVDCPVNELDARVKLVRRLIALDLIKLGDAQSFGIKALIIGGKHVESPWIRSILCRELERLCDHSAGLFATRDLMALLEFKVSGLSSKDKLRLRKGILNVEAANAVGWTASRLVFKDRATRLLFLSEHAKFQQSKDATVRREFLTRTCRAFGVAAAPVLVSAFGDDDLATVEDAIRLAGELEAGACVEPLLHLLRTGSKRTLLKEAVVALGKIGHPGSVEELTNALVDPVLGDSVRTALARINSGEASFLLKDLLEKRRRTADIHDPIWVQLRYLMSDAFRRDEQRRISAARKRWRPAGN